MPKEIWSKIKKTKTDVFDAILSGQKPDATQYAWAVELAKLMRENDLITQNAEEFFSHQGFEPEGLTNSHPYPYAAFQERKQIEDGLKSRGINNAKIFGWPWSDHTLSRKREQRLDQQNNIAEFFILPCNADFAIYQDFFHFLNKSPEIAKLLKESDQFKRVVIQRSSNSHEPLLRNFFSNSPQFSPGNAEIQSSLNSLYSSHHLQFHVSSGLEETLSICEREQQTIQRHLPTFNQKHRSSSPSRPPTVIVVASTSEKKEHEVQTLFGDSVRIVRLPRLLGPYVDALEEEGTLTGNAVGQDHPKNTGKAYTIIRHMRDIISDTARREQYFKSLKKNGISPNDPLYVYVDDRAIDFDPRLERYFDFSDTENIRKPRFQSKPGSVETSYYFTAAKGVENFINRVNQGIQKAREDGVDIKNISKHPCVSSLFVIVPATGELKDLYAAAGVTQSKLLTAPLGPNLNFRQTDDFIVPDDPRNHEGASAAQMGFLRYTCDFSPNAKTAEILREQTGIAGSSQLNTVRDPKIAVIGKGLTNTDPRLPPLPGTFEEGSVDKWLSQLDGVIIQDRGDLSKSAFADIFFSLLVSKRVDPQNSGKLLLANRGDKEIDNLYTHFENVVNLRYSTEFPERTMPSYKTDDQRRDQVDFFLSRYERPHQQAASQARHKVNDDLVDFSLVTGNRPGIFIACSATSNAESDHRSVRKAVMAFAEKGYDIYYGSGSRFMMREVLNEKKAWNEAHPERPINVIGISTENILSKEAQEGKHSDEVTFPHTTETVHGRIRNLLANCVFQVTLNGGMGTGREVTAFVRTRDENNPITKGKDALIVNPCINRNKPHLYHYLLKYYGEEDVKQGIEYLSERNTHIVGSVDEAISRVPHATELRKSPMLQKPQAHPYESVENPVRR